MDDLKAAIEYFEKSYEFYIEADDIISAAYSISNIGEMYYFEGNYTKALEYQLKALDIMQEFEDQRHSGMQLQTISHIYEKLQDFSNAKKCYQESIEIFEKIGEDTD